MIKAPSIKDIVRSALRARFSDLLFFRTSDFAGVADELSEDLDLDFDLPPFTTPLDLTGRCDLVGVFARRVVLPLDPFAVSEPRDPERLNEEVFVLAAPAGGVLV